MNEQQAETPETFNPEQVKATPQFLNQNPAPPADAYQGGSVFDNSDETARAMNVEGLRAKLETAEENAGMVTEVKRHREAQETPQAIFDLCQQEGDKYENVIVLRFNEHKGDNGECCGLDGNTMMSIHGGHAAGHAEELLLETAQALRGEVMKEVFRVALQDDRLPELIKQAMSRAAGMDTPETGKDQAPAEGGAVNG